MEQNARTKRKMQGQKGKCKDDTKSDSLDRCEQVEKSKIQILTILRLKITQMFTKKCYLLSKFSKLHNLETHFCELLRPRAPPFQKIKQNP